MPDIRRTSFKLNEKIEDESEFEIIFSHNNTVYQYGFSIRDDLEINDYIVGTELKDAKFLILNIISMTDIPLSFFYL